MEFLDKILELLSQYYGIILAVGIPVIDVLLRLFKTDKPASVLQMISRGMSKVAAVLQKSSEIVDKLIPDRLK